MLILLQEDYSNVLPPFPGGKNCIISLLYSEILTHIAKMVLLINTAGLKSPYLMPVFDAVLAEVPEVRHCTVVKFIQGD